MKSVFSIDLRSLALFRVGVALVVLYDLATRFAAFDTFHTAAGVAPPHVVRDYYQGTWHWSLCWLSDSPGFQYAILAMAALSGLTLLIGLRTRIATIACWLLVVSLHVSCPPLISGGDTLLVLSLFWGMFLPLGARWSVDARHRPMPIESSVFSGATIGLLLQIAMMYFFTGIAKWNDAWLGGSALSEALAVELILRPPGRLLREYQGLTSLTTYLTLAAELILPFVLFSPWRTAWCRSLVLVVLALLHIGIELTMNVQIFSLAALAAISAFVPEVWWEHRPLKLLARWLDQLFPHRAEVTESRQLRRQKTRTAQRVQSEDTMQWWLRSAIPLVCIAYVLGYNLLGSFATPRLRRELASYQRLGEALSLTQSWRMFAEPRHLNKDFACVARLRDDTLIDLFRGSSKVFDRSVPPETPVAFSASRWKQFVNVVVERNYRPFALSMLQHLCDEWNAAAETPGRQILECWFVIYPYGTHPLAETTNHAELFHLDLRAQGQYIAGIRHGHWRLFHDNGTKAAQGIYNRGAMHGPWTFWDASGNVEAEGNFRNGRQIGTWKVRNPEGELQSVDFSHQHSATPNNRSR